MERLILSPSFLRQRAAFAKLRRMNKSLIFLVFFFFANYIIVIDFSRNTTNDLTCLFMMNSFLCSRDIALSLEKQFGKTFCQSLGIYSIPESFCLSVVISVYNEEKTLEKLVHTVAAVPIRKQIILINDCSKDASKDVMKKLAKEFQDDAANSILLLEHEKSQGKGAALRTGFAHAMGDVILIQDAGLEYNPAEYPFPLAPILKKKQMSSLEADLPDMVLIVFFVLLAFCRQSIPYHAIQLLYRSQSHRYGNLLQGFPSRCHSRHFTETASKPLRVCTGNYGTHCQVRLPNL